MAVITPAIGTPGASAKAHRQAFSALVGQDVETFVNSVTATGPGHGLVRSGHLAVSEKSGTTNMSVDVAAGIAFITGNSSLAQGVYVATNDAVTNLAVATADATNGRRDLVVMQVRDNAEDSGGSTDARLFVVTGTPSGSPADPTIPDGCLVLARVVVAALATSITDSDITNLATVTASPGPLGVVGYAKATADQTSITTETDLTSLTATWTARSSRLYKISFHCIMVNTDTFAATETITVKVTDGSNTMKFEAPAAGVEQQGAGVGGTITLGGVGYETGLSGSVTRKLRAVSTTSGCELAASADSPAFFIVEDIGPA